MEIWTPCEDLFEQCKEKNFGVLILNTPINFSFNHQLVLDLWNRAKIRITVDGGTKRWLQWLTRNQYEFQDVLNPDLITGDMDSLPEDILNYFKKTDTKIIVTPNQNETDYVKALKELYKHCKIENIELDTVYVLADTSGRFDQIMANINALFKSRHILENVKVFQIAADSLTWLLDKGEHSISIPARLRQERNWCALIPIGASCTVTTTDKQKMEFGGLVSSSNTYEGVPVVTVETDVPVVWSMSMEALL